MGHRGRGPAVWSGPDVALGQQRAGPDDPGPMGHPIPCTDGRCRLVLDGQVQAPTIVQGGRGDGGEGSGGATSPESLLRLFLADGVSAVRRLGGVFAFAVWQDEERRLTLVRDPLGIKPLHYVHAPDGSLFFASEPKGLLAGDVVRPNLNYSALPAYLASHGTSGESTLFEGIRRVPPGHVLIWQEGQIRLEPYWDLSSVRPDGARTEPEMAEQFAELLRSALRRRLSLVPSPGALLSGSIGSAAMVAALRELAGPDVRTYSVIFAGEPTLQPGSAIAAPGGTAHTQIVLSAREFFDALPDAIWHQDTPLAEPTTVPLYHAAACASEDVQMLLSAAGCDELLGRHPRYRCAVTAARRARRLNAGLALFGMRNGIRRTAEAMGRRSRRARWLARRLPETAIDIRRLYLDELAVFGVAHQLDLVTDEARERGAGRDPYGHILESLEHRGEGDPLDQLLSAGLRVCLPELATTHDRIGAAFSIESDTPFLDREMVRFTAGLPARMRLRGRTAHFLLQQRPGNRPPPGLLQRTAAAAPIPVGRWLRGAFRPLLHEYVLSDRALGRGILRPDAVGYLVAEHESGRSDHARELWALINLEVWQRLYVDGEAVALAPQQASAATA